MKAIRRSGTSFAWQVNSYDGCEHGCLYCYGTTIRRKKYEDWIRPTPKMKVIGDLTKDIRWLNSSPDTKDEIRDIMLCSCTDGYQDLEPKHRITEQVIAQLIAADLPFTVLTKNTNVLRDIGLFKGYDKCRVGFTIMTLDDGLREVLEPNASPIGDRCDALAQLRAAGVSTYCSVEPIMPDKRSDPMAIVDALKDSVDLFEFGKWNHYSGESIREKTGIVYDEDYYIKVFTKLIPYLEKEGIRYCVAMHSEEFLRSHGFRFIAAQLAMDRPYLAPTKGEYCRCVVEPAIATQNPSQAHTIEAEANDHAGTCDAGEDNPDKSPTKPRRIKVSKRAALGMFERGQRPSDLARIGGITRSTLNRYYREWKARSNDKDEFQEKK